MPVFPAWTWFSAGWESPVLILAISIALICGTTLWHLNRNRPADVYDPQRAWLRAGLYFTGCFIVSWTIGVLPVLVSQPLAFPYQLRDPLWITATIALFIVILFGYGVVWRQGTISHGRPLLWLSVLPFGLFWGLASGQMLLCVWALIEKLGFGSMVAAIGTYLIGGTLNGLWHSKYWDSRVSPDHNIVETNTRKVMLAHMPNLILSLGHMVLFANPMVFVLAQTLALTVSTAVMHFPPFWGPAAACQPQHKPEGRLRAEL